MRYEEPEFLPWDARRVPLTFIAGYLGAGKTTLINAALASADRPIAVIVNDVGQVNIDARLIAKHSGDTIELTNGCVCCSLVDGFGAAFDQIRSRPEPPDHVVVELSGVAEPERVLPWGRSAGFKLDGIMTLVAADQFASLLDDERIGELVRKQVASADLIAVTKTELVDHPSEVLAQVETLSDAPVMALNGADATSAILRIGGRRPGGVTDIGTTTLFDHHVVDTLPLPVPLDLAGIERLLDGLPDDTVRAKGVAQDASGQRWLIQVVGRRRDISPLAEPETEPPTDLVVIRLP